MRIRGGISQFFLYRQIIRPILTYAFPIWFWISSHQMERLRMWERRVLRTCLGLRKGFMVNGSYRSTSCRTIYDKTGFDRIDLFMMKGAEKFVEKSVLLENEIVAEALRYSYDAQSIMSKKHLPPAAIPLLKNEGLLYIDNRLLFYHRRYNSYDTADVVYNTAQWYIRVVFRHFCTYVNSSFKS